MLCTEHAPSDRDNGYRSVVLRLHGVRYGVPAALLSNRGEARLRELLAEWHPSHGADGGPAVCPGQTSLSAGWHRDLSAPWRTLQRAAVGFSRQYGELQRRTSVRRCTLKRAPHYSRPSSASSFARRIASARSMSLYLAGSRLRLVHSSTAARFCISISVG